MRRTAAAAAILFGAWLLLAPRAWAADKSVRIQSVSAGYKPASVDINVGDTVTWTNDDTIPHTVTSDADSQETFDSSQMAPNLSFQHTFSKAGTFTYHCANHPSQMKATVHVAEVVTTTLPVTTTTTTKPTTTTAKPTTTTAKPTTTTAKPTTTTTAPTTTVTIGVLETTSEPTTTSSTSTTLALASGSHKGGSSGGKIALIVVALLAVGGTGGYGLWRLRPNRDGVADEPPAPPAA